MNASVSLRADDRDVARARAAGTGTPPMWSSCPWVSTIGDDVVEPVPDRGEVGEDHVDAGLVLLGEQHAAVDDQQLAGVLEDGHVAADLAEAAEPDDAQTVRWEFRGTLEFWVRVAHDPNANRVSASAFPESPMTARGHRRRSLRRPPPRRLPLDEA